MADAPDAAAAAATSGGGGWAWAEALPEWVRAKGWTARSYQNGRLEASYYHCSLFDVPREYWAQDPAPRPAANGWGGVGAVGVGWAGAVGGLSLGLGGGRGGSVLEGEEDEEEGAAASTAATAITSSTTMTCSRCRVSLPIAERVAHYQSPWHLLNLRRSLTKRPPLSLEEYEASRHTEGEGNGDGDEEGSGSESSGDEEGEGAEGIATFESAAATVVVPPGGYAVTVWSPLIATDPKRSTPSELLDGLRGLGHPITHKWAVLMLRSGRFAGGIFEGPKVLAHKAFRRYTQRAKQGGSQSSYDKKGKKAQSVGAQLRRHGEQQTREDVRAILGEWVEMLGGCDLIFLSVPKAMRGVLIGGEGDKPLLRKDDPRLRPVPFMVEQPSFAEVQAICNKLATVRFSAPNIALPTTAPSPLLPSHAPLTAAKEEEGKEGEGGEGVSVEPDPNWNAALAAAVRRGKAEAVVGVLEGMEDEEERARVLGARDLMEGEGTSLLHLAAAKGNAEVIDALLSHGASPLLLDSRDRPPYFLATARPARDAFRRARGREPDRWDWDRAGVPEALTDELEERRKEKAKEKKKRAKAKKQQEKARDAQQADQAAAVRAAGEVADAAAAESDEERDKGKPRCDSCGKAVRVLYTRLEYIYCSTDCVQNHKRALLAKAAMRRLGGGGK